MPMDRELVEFPKNFLGGADAVGIRLLDETSLRAVEIGLDKGQIRHWRSFDMPLEKGRLPAALARRYPGRLAMPFPAEHSYTHLWDVPRRVSRKMAQKILQTRADLATPFSGRPDAATDRDGGFGGSRYALAVKETGDSVRYLQCVLSDHALPFLDEIRLGMVQFHPGSLWMGFSDIFHFPKDEGCLLLYQKGEGVQLAWGKDGRLLGMRHLQKALPEDLEEVLLQTQGAFQDAKYFYSWCDERYRFSLSKFSEKFPQFPWTHLDEKDLPEILKGCDGDLELVCAAMARALNHHGQPLMLDASSAAARNPRLRKAVLRTAILTLLLAAMLEASWLLKLQSSSGLREDISDRVRKVFYSVFPSTTPMLDPVRQIQEKFERPADSARGLVGSDEFLKGMALLQEKKPSGIQMTRMSIADGKWVVEGASDSLDEVRAWVKALQEAGFESAVLGDVRRGSGGNYFIFELVIDLTRMTDMDMGSVAK